MKHRTSHSNFHRKSGPRKALIRGLVHSLVERGRIRTTVAKAKSLRPHVEKAITLGKKGTLHARRVLLSRYPQAQTVSTLVDKLAKDFKNRPGGYTRILKLGARPGDQADMALIEFVNYKPGEKVSASTTAVSDKKAIRQKQRKNSKHKKHLRKIQSESRRIRQRASV